MNQIGGQGLRAAAGLLAGAVGAAGLTLVLARLTAAGLPPAGAVRVEDLVSLVVTGAGTAVSAWLAASTGIALLCVLARLAGSSWRAGEATVHRLAPAIVRRALAVTVTTGLGLTLATGAHAAAPEPAPAGPTAVASAGATTADSDLGWSPTSGPAAPTDMTWHPTGTVTTPPTTPATSASPSPTATSLPDDVAPGTTTTTRTTGATPSGAPVPVTISSIPTAAAPTPAPAAAPAANGPAATADAATPAETVVVQQGDSLWEIAARHVPRGATNADIAAAWPQWFETNRDVIGDDPDVLQPGQHLRAPAAAIPAPAAPTSPDSPTPAQTEVTR